MTKNFPYFYEIGIHLEEIILSIEKDDEKIKEIWFEIINYLNLLTSEYDLPDEIPPYFDSIIEDDTIESAFIEYQSYF